MFEKNLVLSIAAAVFIAVSIASANGSTIEFISGACAAVTVGVFLMLNIYK